MISCSSVCLVVLMERYASGPWDSRGVWPPTVSMTTACGRYRPMNHLPRSTQGGETGGSGPQTYWIPTTEHLYVRKNLPYWRYTSDISLLTFYHLQELNQFTERLCWGTFFCSVLTRLLIRKFLSDDCLKW